MTILKNKKSILILCLLLTLLVLPRIMVYSLFGSGMVSTDAEWRYFPQVKELSESLTNFFNQTGPFYSLFLLFFENLNINVIAGPVLIQHILGIITALLVFYYFKKINLFLAFFVTILVYSSWIALWLEHTILRDSLAAFFAVLFVILVSLAARETKYFKFLFAVLAGLAGIILIFIRIEFAVLFILMPLILFVIKKREFPEFKLKDKKFWQWNFGYFLPLIIIFVIYVLLPQSPQIGTTYGSTFVISYYSLIPEAFYYENSEYPELLKKYQQGVENNNGQMRESLIEFYEVTEEYLLEHPEIDLSMLQIMDQIYIEIMTKNTLVYLKSFFVNLKNHLLGTVELNSLITKYKLSESASIEKVLQTYNVSMVWFSIILFWSFLVSLPLLVLKWKTLPSEVVMAFLVTTIHILVLAFWANPAHRFRYPLDPFIYFFQIYLILILLKTIFLGFRNTSFFKNNTLT